MWPADGLEGSVRPDDLDISPARARHRRGPFSERLQLPTPVAHDAMRQRKNHAGVSGGGPKPLLIPSCQERCLKAGRLELLAEH